MAGADPIRHLVEQRMRDRGLTMAGVSRQIGRNHAYLQQYLKRNTPEELDESDRTALARILNVEESKLRPDRLTVISAIESKNHAATSYLVPGYRIAEMDVRASAGPGVLVEKDTKIVGEWELPRELVRSVTASPAERMRVITIIGDSMHPIFHAGEKVLVDTADTSPTPPGIFVVWDGNGLVVKRVAYTPFSDPPVVKISSENPKYDPYERVLGEAYIQGRVLGKWHWT